MRRHSRYETFRNSKACVFQRQGRLSGSKSMRCLNLLLLGIVTFASTGCCVSMSGGRHPSCLSSLSSSKKHPGTCQCAASRNGKSPLFGRSQSAHGFRPTPLFPGDTWPSNPGYQGQFISDGCGEVWNSCGECTECGMAPATCSAPSGMVSPSCEAPSCVQPIYSAQPDCHAPAEVFGASSDCGSGPVYSTMMPHSPDCTAPHGPVFGGHPPVMSQPQSHMQPPMHPQPQMHPQVHIQPNPAPPAHFSAPGEVPQPQERHFASPANPTPPTAAPVDSPVPVPAPSAGEVPAPATPVDPVSWEVPAFPPLR